MGTRLGESSVRVGEPEAKWAASGKESDIGVASQSRANLAYVIRGAMRRGRAPGAAPSSVVLTHNQMMYSLLLTSTSTTTRGEGEGYYPK